MCYYYSHLSYNQLMALEMYLISNSLQVENSIALCWIIVSYCQWNRIIIFTHRRSIAERGGCFQWRLFVSLFVNTITSEGLNEWLNVKWWNLAVRCVAQKSRPSSNVKVKGRGHRGQRKSASFCLGAVLGAVVSSASSMAVGKSAHAVYWLFVYNLLFLLIFAVSSFERFSLGHLCESLLVDNNRENAKMVTGV